jgi:hypothetical protein
MSQAARLPMAGWTEVDSHQPQPCGETAGAPESQWA